MATIWETLGIEPTTDESVIRRAYARELKLHRPDQDPQGYQQLREAFDAAKEFAKGEIIWGDDGRVQAVINLDVALSELPHGESEEVSQPVVPQQPDWQRATLEEDAERFSVQLLTDESDALNALRFYLDHHLPDALEARRVFSLELAEALSQRQGITRSLVNEVSDILGWDLGGYRDSQLPYWVIHALEAQIDTTDADNHWDYLRRQADLDWQGRLAWRILSGEIPRLPWWARLIPDFVQRLMNQVAEIRYAYPQLLDRVNPELTRRMSTPVPAISRLLLVVIWFWGFGSYILVRDSSHLLWQAVTTVGIVLLYLWGTPSFLASYERNNRLARISHIFLWLLSWGILAVPLFHIYALLYHYPPAGAGVARVCMFTAVIAYPVWWIVRTHIHQWYAMPFNGVMKMIMSPALFLCRLPPVAIAVGLLILPQLYSFAIKWFFFFS
jgi:hypothetical protein